MGMTREASEYEALEDWHLGHPRVNEQEALPISCKALCIHYAKCKPFVNPVGCTKIELREDVKQSIKQAGYVQLSPDQTPPEFLTLVGISRLELVNKARESMLEIQEINGKKYAFRKVEIE